MGRASRSSKGDDRRRARAGIPGPIKWIAALGLLAALIYGLSITAGVPYDENDIRAVDFTVLDAGEKRRALQAANAARCPCGCGMNLAQCVSTDTTCPLRETNIQRIRTIVTDTNQP
jgi:hypothetical protein